MYRFLGKLFVFIGVFVLGYSACNYGWLTMFIEWIKQFILKG